MAYKKRKKIREVIRLIKDEGIQFYPAVLKSGIRSVTTWYKWEKKNPRLLKLRERAEEFLEQSRGKKVEDALLNTATGGALVGVKETFDRDGKLKSRHNIYAGPNVLAQIFYLTNKLGLIWKDRRALVNNVIQNKVQVGEPKDQYTGDDEEFRRKLKAEFDTLIGKSS